MKIYQPSSSELLEMSLAGFAQHAQELLNKHNQMTEAQREEFREIGRQILSEKEAA